MNGTLTCGGLFVKKISEKDQLHSKSESVRVSEMIFRESSLNFTQYKRFCYNNKIIC